MICTIGLGSNLGDRREFLERAAKRLREISGHTIKTSPVYTTPAMLPNRENIPDDFRNPYLNAVVEISWRGTPEELLNELKKIESELGRKPSERWGPRCIDLDLLLFGDRSVNEPHLIVPHIGLYQRSFVLDPLKDLNPAYLQNARKLNRHSPLWMGILNLTPDSFSDSITLAALDLKIQEYLDAGVQIFDFGGESTRPGATEVALDEEWARLEPGLEQMSARGADQEFWPAVSVDTRRAKIASRAIARGANWINDVSGLADPEMLAVLNDSDVNYVLMHSLSVPANPQLTISKSVDPVDEIKKWAQEKLDELERAGINYKRIIFDPGIGFGKTPTQSAMILKRIDEFMDLPVRILVGHSRKGFLRNFTIPSGPQAAADRDPESIGVSLRLAERGVDILRVHSPSAHIRAFQAFQESARDM